MSEIPADLLARLQTLHERMEDGEELTDEEKREMIVVERQANRAATAALARLVRKRSSSSD